MGQPASDERLQTPGWWRSARIRAGGIDRNRALLALLTAVLLAVLAFDGAKMYRKTVALDRANDFELFWEGGRRVLSGEDDYAIPGWGYPYPPPAYLVFAPLGLVPLPVAAVGWHLLKGALLAACAFALWSMLVRAGFRRVAAPALALTLLGVARSLDSDLQLGQSNLLVCAVVIGVAWAYLTHRDELAGLLLAGGILFKLTPGLFLLYFAWQRRWRVVRFAAVSGLLLGLVLPAAAFGPARTAELYRSFAAGLATSLDGSQGEGADAYAPGQSLVPVVTRLLSPVAAVSPGRVDSVVTIHLADLDPRAAAAIGRILVGLALGLLLALTFARPRDAHEPRRALLELALVTTVMLLAAPYARKAHFVSLALAFAPIAAYALDTRSRGLVAVVIAAALLPGLTSPNAVGRSLSHSLTAHGPFTFASLLLLGAAAVALVRERRRVGHRAAHGGPADLELSVFLPAYNEGGVIGRLVEQALEVLPEISSRYEVIVVDDGSTDDTPDVVAALAQGHPEVVRHVRHPQNRGYGAAVKTGIASARYDWVFFTDADGQFDLRELPEFVRPIGDPSIDAVIGYRLERRDPFFRRMNAHCWSALVRTLFGIGARDIACAYKLLPTELTKRLALESEGALISTELLVKLDRAGCRVAERGVTHLPRLAGVPTGASPKVILRAFRELFRFRAEIARFELADRPLRPAPRPGAPRSADASTGASSAATAA